MDFTLEGGARKGLRNTHNRLEKEGCALEILPPTSISDRLSELKDVSDALAFPKEYERERIFPRVLQ